MQVRRRLKINAVISIITALIILLILCMALYRLNSENGKGKIAEDIIALSFERDALRSDYLRSSSKRSNEQWFAKHEQVGRLLKSASEKFRDAEDIKTLGGMLEDHESIGKIFRSIMENRERRGTSDHPDELSLDIEDRLVSQMDMRTYELVIYGQHLLETSREARSSALRLAGAGIVFVFVILVAATLINSDMMSRTITDRIRRLRDCALVIGGGDLDHKIDIMGDDEFAELSDVFNAMTTKLRKSYSDIENENSERRQAERVIIDLNRDLAARNSELVTANRELEAFSYSVSHDLRAPVRHISSYMELLTKNMGSQTGDKAKHYMTVIAGASKKMNMLIDDLLAFSRMGRTDMKKTTVNIPVIIRDVIKDMAPDIKERDVEWKIGALPDVYGDTNMLRLVIINLISNAIKYSAPRFRAEIEIGCTEEAEEFIFFVKDNGVGFDMEFVDKLFGVFQRLHPGDEFEGTGIGLANVQRIISRHGGRTWAEGAVGQGAVFYFTIPKIEKIKEI